MIVKTDAVVLKSMRYRDTSKIVTFYTRKFGKLAAIAKGSRGMSNKFGASLEPMTEVSLVLYKKEQRELQLVSQCDIVRPFKRIHTEIEKMGAAMSVIELLNQITHSEEENPGLYALVAEMLESLEPAAKNFHNFVYAFELRLASLSGFTPVFDRCAACGKPNSAEGTGSTVLFRIDRGGLLCSSCAEARGHESSRRSVNSAPIRMPTAQILNRLLHARLDSLAGIEYPDGVRNELDETLRCYLQYHFEGIRPLKSAEVFRMITP
ncbi:MAG TPA: DNA repair protein RecO [Bacteroidota bacterium]